MSNRVINAPNREIIEPTEKVIFLAGPIQGAPLWHDQLQYQLDRFSGNLTICSPKRLAGKEKSRLGYQAQVQWETDHLNLAAQQGVIIFWWANQAYKVYENTFWQWCPGLRTERHYAKTTRIEWGEWKAKHDLVGCKVILGLDTKWVDERYLTTRLQQDGSQIPIVYSLEDMAKKIVEMLHLKT